MTTAAEWPELHARHIAAERKIDRQLESRELAKVARWLARQLDQHADALRIDIPAT